MREEDNTATINVRTYLLFGLLFALILVPLVLAITYAVRHEGDANQPYVSKLREIASQTPLYPGFQPAGEKVVLKRDMVYFFTWYKAHAQMADVKAFYRRELVSRGWTPPQPPSSSFFESDPYREDYRRGDYFIAIEQDDRQTGKFSIVFIWDPQ